ncbi:MAG: redoxin domain-containing protein [Planctomycetes bacterium]|nr:redoxin domain-containing protein [Planctomycetota bacterium]
MLRVSALLSIVLSLSIVAPLRASDEPGHSKHGSAFDTGLRQKPWKMEGIGHSHFPITTKVPEVQEWFDQGNTLLHSFWFEEAERSFRWCIQLDPDCAMAYWGLARCGMNWFASQGPAADPALKRYRDFLKEAVRRKGSVSERERMYIEAWGDGFDAAVAKPTEVLARRLQKLVIAFPDDVEAKALYALFSIRPDGALGTEMVIRAVLAKEPDHPGAHHYRIHNWDGVATEQGLSSCARYGPAAPNVGHANHMPGHNYSKLGLWHEAAISMDSATRVELRYMNERLALPFETWNFAHNRNYLCYIQEQLGMEAAARAGARTLLAAPRNPNPTNEDGDETFSEGLTALVRGLVKFERWDTILEKGSIPWGETPEDESMKAWVETLAFAGLGRAVDARARFGEFEASIAALEKKDPDAKKHAKPELEVAEGLVFAAEGNVLDATRLLGAAADAERHAREADEYENDPPFRPWPVHRLLGDVFLGRGEPRLAVEAYELALKVEANDAFTLSGLARAHAQLGNRDAAQRHANALAHVWSGADAGLEWRTSVDALGLVTKPFAPTPAPERRYEPAKLDALGPNLWAPFAAPKLDCVDSEGVAVRLEDLRGKNVLLVFYLGKECVHCMEQLRSIDGKKSELAKLDTVVLAVSSASPEKNKSAQELGELSVRLLSDKDHENARRFTSYDDFEGIELHSTILIDKQGRVHWKRTGGDPFQDVDFLVAELTRMNEAGEKKSP